MLYKTRFTEYEATYACSGSVLPAVFSGPGWVACHPDADDVKVTSQ
jgi:hypothetical protein